MRKYERNTYKHNILPYGKRVLLAFLTATLVLTTINVRGNILFAQQTAQGDMTRDVALSQQVPTAVEAEPKQEVARPETKVGNPATFPDEKTTSESDITISENEATPQVTGDTPKNTDVTDPFFDEKSKIEQLLASGYVEDETLRTIQSKSFVKDGHIETILYLQPVHFEVNGKLEAYDLTLRPERTSQMFSLNKNAEPARYTVNMSDTRVTIPTTLEAHTPVVIGKGMEQISVTLDTKFSHPEMAGNTARFQDETGNTLDVTALETGVSLVQKEITLSEPLTYILTVSQHQELIVQDNQVVVIDNKTQEQLDTVMAPRVFTTSGDLVPTTFEVSLESVTSVPKANTETQKETNGANSGTQSYAVTFAATNPPGYPVTVQEVITRVGGSFGGNVKTYGMNVIDGNRTYGADNSEFGSFFMLGYVLDPLYYPSGLYQGVASLDGLNLEAIIGPDQEVTNASFHLLEFTAESSIFAQNPININMSQILTHYAGYPDNLTWNQWAGSVPSLQHLDTVLVSKYLNNFATFNITGAVQAWNQGAPNFGLYLTAERQDDGLLFANHHPGNAALPDYWQPIRDGRPYITISHKPSAPIPTDYPLENVTLNLRPFTASNREGALKFQALGFDGITTPGSTVTVEVYHKATGNTIFTDSSLALTGQRLYPYYEPPLYQDIPLTQKYYGRSANYQLTNRLLTTELEKNVLYGVRYKAETYDDTGNITATSNWKESDTFQLYTVTSFDRMPRIMQFYGITNRNLIMQDNHMVDELVLESNELFIRNPQKNAGKLYQSEPLSEEDKKKIDFSLMGRGVHCEFGYEPINLNTGNFFYSNEDASLIEYDTQFLIKRHYNSIGGGGAGFDSIFGRNWSFNWDKTLTLGANGDAIYQDGTGRRLVFTKEPDGSFTAPVGEELSLKKVPHGTKTVVEDTGYYDAVDEAPVQRSTEIQSFIYVLETKNQETYEFSVDGYLKTATLNQYGHTLNFEYFENKNLNKMVLSSGKVIEFAYNPDGFVSHIKLPDGNVLAYTYDASGNLTGFTDAMGFTMTYAYEDRSLPHVMTSYTTREDGSKLIENSYDNLGRVTKQLDAKGDVVTFTYFDDHTEITSFDGTKEYVYFDNTKRTTKKIDRDGSEVTYAYDTNNNRTQKSTANPADTLTYTYDAHGNVLTETRLDGAVKSYTYDARNNPLTVLDVNGGLTSFTYDAKSNIIQVTYPDGTVETNTYNEHGQKVAHTDTLGFVTTYTYDAAGNKTSETDSFGTKTFASDALSMLTQETDSLGNTITYIRNNRGELLEKRTPLGTFTYQYDADGQKVYETDANGHATRYEYDAWARLIKETDSYGSKTYSYDAFGNMVSSTDELGNITTYTYDTANRLVKTTHPDGSNITNTYNENGQLIVVQDILGNSSRYAYDSLGRKVKDIDPQNRETTYVYDITGNLLETTYPDGLMETKTYDVMGRIMTETDKRGNVTTYTYDGAGNVLEKSTNDEKVETFTYGQHGTLLSETDSLGYKTTKTYNTLGLAELVTLKNGVTQTYQYDGHYNIVSVATGAHTVTKTYDGHGNLLTETDELGNVTTYTYTARNQVASITYPDGGLVQYVYDAKGQQISVLDQLGFNVATVYDNMGRVIKTVDGNGNVTTNTYNIKGQLVETVDSLGQKATTTYDTYGRKTKTVAVTGVESVFTYDEFDRIIKTLDSDGYQTHNTYNTYGDITLEENEQGHKTFHTYDTYGQEIERVDSRGGSTKTEYDTLGRIIKTVDSQGNSTLTTYNPIGQIEAETYIHDHGQVETINTYNQQGFLQVSSKNGAETTYTYDAKGNIINLVLPDGSMSSKTYDTVGRTLTETDGNGAVTTTVYDTKGQVIKEIDALGGITQYVYDGNGNVIETIDALGYSSFTVYDALNRTKEIRNKNGGKDTFTYNSRNQVVTSTNAGGITTTNTYDDKGNLTQVKHGNVTTKNGQTGHNATYQYDNFNRKISSTYENGYQETYTYTTFGDVLEIKNNLGETITANEYDDLGQVISQRDTYGNKTTFTYNSTGQVIQEVDAKGLSVINTYDPQDRFVSQQDKRGNITTFTYNSLGLKTSETLQGDKTKTYDYDKAGNLIRETDPLGNSTTYSYDGNHQQIEMVDALGGSKKVTYTRRGELASTTNELGQTITYTYDPAGNKISEVDPNGNKVTYQYDVLNRLIFVQNRLGAVTNYGYDAYGNHTYTKDAKGNVITFVQDAMHNLTSIEHPDGNKERFAYDTKGNKTLDVAIDGKKVTYTYDKHNNMTNKTMDGAAFTYEYDTYGRLINMQDKTGTSSFTYNPLDDMLKYQDGKGNSVNYTYDTLGRRSGITYPDGRHVTYTYDKLDNLLEVLDGTAHTTYTYDAGSRLIETRLPNGNSTTYSYDAAGRQLALNTTNGNTIISAFSYQYDTLGNIVEESSNIEGDESKKTYQYDSENQLISSEHKQGLDIKTYTYEYDVTGNRTKLTENINGVITGKQYRFDTSNKLLEVEGTTGDLNVKYTYDTGGNVTKKENKGTGLVEEFTYNAEGKLLAIKNNLGKTIQYSYDGLGNRTEKVETTTLDKHNMKRYLEVQTSEGAFNDEFDAALSQQQTKELLSNLKETMEEYVQTYNQVCPEVEKNGKKESTITYNYVNDVNLAYTEVLQVNGKESTPLHTYIYGVQRIQDDKKGESTQYYNYDGKGSVIGKQVGNDLHLTFKVKYNDDGKPSRNMDNEFGYNGEAHDYHGTQYLRARYYDTNIGRFNQRDPYRGELNTPISQNRYTYVWNNALKYHDKSGNWPSLKGIIGGISGGINGLVNGAKAGWQEGGLLGAIAGGASGTVNGAKAGYQAGSASQNAGDAWNNGWTAGGEAGTTSGYAAGQTISQGGSLYDGLVAGGNAGNTVVDRYEAARREAEEQARREEQRLTEEKQNIENQLRDAGINLSNLNLDGKTLKEQVEILIRIKKICDELEMGTERFDKIKAQQLVDEIIAENQTENFKGFGGNSPIVFGTGQVHVFATTAVLEEPGLLSNLWNALTSIDWGATLTAIGSELTTIFPLLGLLILGIVFIGGLIYILVDVLAPEAPGRVNNRSGFDEIQHSRVLENNMTKYVAGTIAGVEAMGKKPPKHAAHHIVAHSHPVAEPSRKILRDHGIGIDDAVNGVYLPIKRDISDAAYHPSLHTHRYMNTVNEELRRATTRMEVILILRYIALRLVTGNFLI